jgi:hypothetical protein
LALATFDWLAALESSEPLALASLPFATFNWLTVESSVPLVPASLPLATFDWLEALESSVPVAQVS